MTKLSTNHHNLNNDYKPVAGQTKNTDKLESDLGDTMDWGKNWLFDFNAGKTQLVLFDQCNDNSSIDVKMNGTVLEEKSSFKIMGLTFSTKLG